MKKVVLALTIFTVSIANARFGDAGSFQRGTTGSEGSFERGYHAAEGQGTQQREGFLRGEGRTGTTDASQTSTTPETRSERWSKRAEGYKTAGQNAASQEISNARTMGTMPVVGPR